ncbi:MAG: GatB/YqeY domain-containing protein [Alphaproteobacteria bacterium]|nr:GatB/YqeY domain-containing protein [Alphaproteobacteria bacterium]
MLRTALNEALKTAMLAKEARAVSTVRLILAALKDRDIAARSKGNMDGISEDEILGMLQSMIKQRKESITLYEQGGRLELAQQEQEEIVVIERFLPRQMSAEETDAAIKAVMADVEAKGLKDMGKVMTALRERHAGQMDFGKASGLVKSLLS